MADSTVDETGNVSVQEAVEAIEALVVEREESSALVNTPAAAAAVETCVACRAEVQPSDAYLHSASGTRHFTAACFKCDACAKDLTSGQHGIVFRGPFLLCANDAAAALCVRCERPVATAEQITPADPAGGVFHSACFNCNICHLRFASDAPVKVGRAFRFYCFWA